MIRVMLIDDHPIVRDGVRAALEDQGGFEVAAGYASVEDACAAETESGPDVIVLDLELPGASGEDAIVLLRGRFPAARILVFSAYGGAARVAGVIGEGARGYLLKGSRGTEIAAAIRTLAGGGAYFGAGVDPPPTGTAAKDATLTAREKEVLRLVAAGHPSKRIAAELGIAERTVKFHLAAAFRKLGAENRAQAVTLAHEMGVL